MCSDNPYQSRIPRAVENRPPQVEQSHYQC